MFFVQYAHITFYIYFLEKICYNIFDKINDLFLSYYVMYMYY